LSYKLVYTQRAVKDLSRLEPRVKQRIGRTLLRYEKNPLKFAEKLSDSQLGTYRFRIGHFRVVFDMDGDIIVILRVGHRKDICRRS
jgi:mRNA interferase RelE/StbE